ncbi:MAG: hypothetical protein ACREUE_12450 [Panacagrimonas sp.]
MRFARAGMAVALIAAAGSAQAWGLGARIGTTGIGGDFGFDVAPTLGGRIGYSAGSISRDLETDDVNYDAKAKLSNLNLLLDWSPLGPFRISFGFIANDNKIDVNGVGNPGTALAGSTVTGQVKADKSFAPYLGIGYGNVWTAGFNFYFDLGIMFQGSPQVSLTATCSPSTPPAQCTAAQNEVAAERQRLQDKVDRYKYYPVANIGITFGF